MQNVLDISVGPAGAVRTVPVLADAGVARATPGPSSVTRPIIRTPNLLSMLSPSGKCGGYPLPDRHTFLIGSIKGWQSAGQPATTRIRSFELLPS